MGRPREEINIDNISEGMVLDSYDMLCQYLNIKPISNRKQQLERIGRYIEIEKIGCHKYLIKKILIDNNPNKKTRDIFNNSNNKYLYPACSIIISQINRHSGKYICNNTELMFDIGMVNERYVTDNVEEDYEKIPSFPYYVKRELNSIIQMCVFKGLCERKRIICREYNIVYSRNGERFVTGNDNECKYFNVMLNEVLKKYRISNYSQLFYTDKGKIALEELHERALDEFGWKKFIRKYKLTLSPKVNEDILKKLKSDNVEACRRKMNDLIIDRIRKVMLKKGQEYYNYNPEYEQKIAIGDDDTPSKKGYEDYCANLEYLIDKYIRI